MLFGVGINNSDRSLVEFNTTIWYETLYDSMEISQLNFFFFFFLWTQKAMDPEIVRFIRIKLPFAKISHSKTHCYHIMIVIYFLIHIS